MKISPKNLRLGFWGWALGLLLLRADLLDAALAEARTSIWRDPRFHHARVLEAVVLDRQGHTVEAGAALAMAHHLCMQLTLSEITLIHGRKVGERMCLLWGRQALECVKFARQAMDKQPRFMLT